MCISKHTVHVQVYLKWTVFLDNDVARLQILQGKEKHQSRTRNIFIWLKMSTVCCNCSHIYIYVPSCGCSQSKGYPEIWTPPLSSTLHVQYHIMWAWPNKQAKLKCIIIKLHVDCSKEREQNWIFQLMGTTSFSTNHTRHLGSALCPPTASC